MTKSNTIFKPSKQLKTSSSKSKPTAVASSAVASDTISADSYQDEEFDEYQQDDFDDYDGDEVAVGLQPQHLKMGNLSAASVNAPIISLKSNIHAPILSTKISSSSGTATAKNASTTPLLPAAPSKPTSTLSAQSNLPLERSSLLSSLSNLGLSSKTTNILLQRWNELTGPSGLIDLEVSCFYELWSMAPKSDYSVMKAKGKIMENGVDATPSTHDRGSECEDWRVRDVWSQAPAESLLESGVEECGLPWMVGRGGEDGKVKEKKKREKKGYGGGGGGEKLGVFMKKVERVMSGVLGGRGGGRVGGGGGFGDDILDVGGEREAGNIVEFGGDGNVQEIVFVEERGLVALVLAATTPSCIHKSSVLYYDARPPFRMVKRVDLYPHVSLLSMAGDKVLYAGREGSIVADGIVADGTVTKGNETQGGQRIWAAHGDEIVGVWTRARGKGVRGWSLDKKARLRSWVLVEGEVVFGDEHVLKRKGSRVATKASSADYIQLVKVYHGKSEEQGDVYLVARESGIIELFSFTKMKPSHLFTRLSSSVLVFGEENSSSISPPILFEPVISMAWFPYSPSYFIAAYVGGVIAVYSVKTSGGTMNAQVPIWSCNLNLQLDLEKKGQVQCVVWSDVRPAVFYVLTRGDLIIFDLSLDTAGPVESVSLPAGLDARSMVLIHDEGRDLDVKGQKICVAGRKGVYWWTVPDDYLDRRGEGDEEVYVGELFGVY